MIGRTENIFLWQKSTSLNNDNGATFKMYKPEALHKGCKLTVTYTQRLLNLFPRAELGGLWISGYAKMN